jgi:Family of unknown function (DUF5662)
MSKNLNYLNYLIRHKWFVLTAGLKTHAPLWRLIIHDWSKFMPCEWKPYAEYFYGTKPANETHKQWLKDRFDDAWLHHQHFNPHHWQHWILRNDGTTRALYMPVKFVKEMVADWMGAGRAITGKWEALQWYIKNKDKIVLHISTRQLVERLLISVQENYTK